MAAVVIEHNATNNISEVSLGFMATVIAAAQRNRLLTAVVAALLVAGLSAGTLNLVFGATGGPTTVKALDPDGVSFSTEAAGPVRCVNPLKYLHKACPQKGPWDHIVDTGLTIFVNKGFTGVTLHSVKLATVFPTGPRLIHTAMLGPRQAYFTDVGWPPSDQPNLFPHWPLKGYYMSAQSGGTLTMSFWVPRGIYKFDTPTVTGTGYQMRDGKRVAVPFSETFEWSWAFCVGHSITKCFKIMSPKKLWSSDPHY